MYKYKIVSANHPQELEKRVNSKLKKGYELSGNIVVIAPLPGIVSGGPKIFNQVLVKRTPIVDQFVCSVPQKPELPALPPVQETIEEFRSLIKNGKIHVGNTDTSQVGIQTNANDICATNYNAPTIDESLINYVIRNGNVVNRATGEIVSTVLPKGQK